MKTIKITTNKNGFYKPAQEEDLQLFMHCCGGHTAVMKEIFFEQYYKIFALHGYFTEITDTTE